MNAPRKPTTRLAIQTTPEGAERIAKALANGELDELAGALVRSVEFRDSPNGPAYHMVAREKCRVLTTDEVIFDVVLQDDEPEEDFIVGTVVATAEWESPDGDTFIGYARRSQCSFENGSGDQMRQRVDAFAVEHELYESALEDLNETVRADIVRGHALATFLRLK